MGVPHTPAFLSRCETRFRFAFAFSRSAHPSNDVRGGRCCFFLIPRKSPLVHRTPVAKKLLLRECHNHSTGLLKLVVCPLSPVLCPLLESRQTLPPPGLVDTQAAVPGMKRTTRPHLPLTDWRLGPPKSVRTHAAQRHRLHQLTTGKQRRLSRKASRILVIIPVPRLNLLQQCPPALVGGRPMGRHEGLQDSHDSVASRANCVALPTNEVASMVWYRLHANLHAQRSRKRVRKLPFRRWPAPSRYSVNSNPQHPQRKPTQQMKRTGHDLGGGHDVDRRSLDRQMGCASPSPSGVSPDS